MANWGVGRQHTSTLSKFSLGIFAVVGFVPLPHEVRHVFSHFVDEPPSIAQGGKGVVVPGCPTCRKRINTMSQFLDHLAGDAMPALLDRLSKEQA